MDETAIGICIRGRFSYFVENLSVNKFNRTKGAKHKFFKLSPPIGTLLLKINKINSITQKKMKEADW